jgi:hypothetical protein
MRDKTGQSEERPDQGAHGEAALLLVESLVHGLIYRSVISVAEAFEIINTAADVKREAIAETDNSNSGRDKTLLLLEAIGFSLQRDISD